MADARTRTQPTIGELSGELTRDTGTLIRQQMELARLELSQRVSRLGRGPTRVVIGGALATGRFLLYHALSEDEHRGGRQLARAGRRASTFASRGARMVRDNPIGFGIAALAAPEPRTSGWATPVTR